MNKFKIYSLIALFTFIFSGCGSDPVAFDGGKAKAQVIFLVSASTGSAGIDSVKITLIDAGKNREVYTDTNGRAVFKGLVVGTYRFSIEKEGYEPMWYDAAMIDAQSQIPMVYDLTVDVDMFAQSVGVSGAVKYTDKDGKVMSADETTVDVELAGIGGGFSWMNPYQQATTNSDGEFSFSNLPAMTNLNISSRKVTVDSVTYATTTVRTVSGKMPGESEIVTPLNMAILAQALDLETDNFDKIGISDDLELIFSQPVDISKIEIGDIKVVFGGDEVIVEPTWSEDARTLTLTPFQGKWWGTGTHTLTLKNLVSKDGAVLNGGLTETRTFNVFAGGTLGDVAGLTFTATVHGIDTNYVAHNTTSIDLEWSSLTNAASYEIYVKTSDDSAYHKVDETVDTTRTLFTNGYFSNGSSAKLMVLGVNSENRSSASDATVLSLSDKDDPTVSTSTFWNVTGTDNSSGTTDFTTDYTTVTFSEAMDTTKAPSLKDEDAANMVYEWEWRSTSSARINAIVPAGGDNSSLTPADLVVDYSSLEDLAGNAVSSDADTISITIF